MFPFARKEPSERATQAWREAAAAVSARWASFVQALPQERSTAFASYVAALDAEEAAAARIERLTLRRAARSSRREQEVHDGAAASSLFQRDR
jgi:hypothetical protein